jgi:hypothetical protein
MDLQEIEDAARAQGFIIDRTARGHIRFTPPDKGKEQVVFSGTPGDQRAIRNGLARLRRQGFVWPPKR